MQEYIWGITNLISFFGIMSSMVYQIHLFGITNLRNDELSKKEPLKTPVAPKISIGTAFIYYPRNLENTLNFTFELHNLRWPTSSPSYLFFISSCREKQHQNMNEDRRIVCLVTSNALSLKPWSPRQPPDYLQ